MTSPPPRHLLISLVSADPAHAGKALRMTAKFRAAGWRVTLLLTVDGVALLDGALGSRPCPVADRPLASLLGEVLAAGAGGLVGGECLKAAGLTPAALPAGMEVAAFPRLEALLAEPELRIMTW